MFVLLNESKWLQNGRVIEEEGIRLDWVNYAECLWTGKCVDLDSISRRKHFYSHDVQTKQARTSVTLCNVYGPFYSRSPSDLLSWAVFLDFNPSNNFGWSISDLDFKGCNSGSMHNAADNRVLVLHGAGNIAGACSFLQEKTTLFSFTGHFTQI